MWRRLACLREKHGGGVRARTPDLQSDALTTTLLRPTWVHINTAEPPAKVKTTKLTMIPSNCAQTSPISFPLLKPALTSMNYNS